MNQRQLSAQNFQQLYRDPDLPNNPAVIRDCVQGILDEMAPRLAPSPLSAWTVLDIGSGVGDYAFEMQRHVRRVVAVEPDRAAFERAQRRREALHSPVTLVHGFIENFHTDERFDVAVSLTTVEHMPEAEKSFAHVLSLLKPGGLLYLTAPNRLWPIECHYGLPFLSWLPLSLANLYLRVTGRGSDYRDCSYMRTYWGMKRLFARLNAEIEFVVPSLDNSYVGVGDQRLLQRWVRRTGIRAIRRWPFLWSISKGFILVIRKR